MKVAVQVNLSTFKSFPYHLLDGITFRKELWAGIYILSIQVVPRETTSIVADYHAIGIKHWHNFENITVTKHHCRCVITDQKLNETLHDKRAIALPRMHSSSQNDALSLSNMVLRALKICDD